MSQLENAGEGFCYQDDDDDYMNVGDLWNKTQICAEVTRH